MANAKKTRTRRGIRRVLVHIVLFALLGLILTPVGIFGMAKYSQAKDARRHDIPVDYFCAHENGKELPTEMGISGFIYRMLTESIVTPDMSEGEASDWTSFFKDRIIDNKYHDVNKLIVEGFAAGKDEETIIKEAVDVYVARIEDRLSRRDMDEEQIKAVTGGIYAELPEESARLIGEANALADGADMQSVLTNLNMSSTPNFMLMRYGSAILIIGVVLLLLAALLAFLWARGDYDSRAKLGRIIEPFDYLLPFMVGVAVFTLYPMIRVFIMSFQERYHEVKFGFGEGEGWGFGNYWFVLFGPSSSDFLRSIGNTALYVLFTVPITAALAIVIAYLLNQKSKLNPLFQTAYFLPMVTTATAIGLVWRLMFNTEFGLINSMLSSIERFFGVPTMQDWLKTGSPKSIPMTVLVVYGIWSSLPFTTILLLSGLQNIDESLYTVAKVDGSKPMRIFFKITVPLLSPTIGLVLIINSISAFKVYTEVFVLWNGSPQDAHMETVTYYILQNIKMPLDGTHSLGYAAAAAMILFAIIFAFTMLQKLVQRKWVYQ
ncbi:MAG: sugar ABC transporter permease [Clostridia bacterium]|nr:sugar ABC transporter permease [Clostridia bacterium]